MRSKRGKQSTAKQTTPVRALNTPTSQNNQRTLYAKRSPDGDGLRYVLLGMNARWRRRLGTHQTVIGRTHTSIRKALQFCVPETVWITATSQDVDALAAALASMTHARGKGSGQFGHLLMLEAPRPRLLESLRSWFRHVVGETPYRTLLPPEQLVDVLAEDSNTRQDLFIGGSVDIHGGLLTLVRGSLDRITVPLALFTPSGSLRPSFGKFAIDDYGSTLRFGKYEATADVLLWEVDGDYRKRAKARQRSVAEGLGPALRRLRKQRGLSQSDFGDVPRRTIARIENGEVQRPHGRTLEVIAQTLGVRAEDIESY